jgi:hypothetical protein
MSLVQQGYAARWVCALLDFPRSQLYRTAMPAPDGEAKLRVGERAQKGGVGAVVGEERRAVGPVQGVVDEPTGLSP